MAKRDLKTLQTYVLNRMGYAYGQKTAFDERIRVWLNEGTEECLEEFHQPWAIDHATANTTADVLTIQLTTAAMRLQRFSTYLTENNRRRPVGLIPRPAATEWLPNRGTSTQRTGVPYRCWHDGFNETGDAWILTFDPVPNNTYVFSYSYYRRLGSPLSATGDTVDGPVELEKVILEYATWQAFRDQYGAASADAIKAEIEFERKRERLRNNFVIADYDGDYFQEPRDLYEWNDTARTNTNTSDPLAW